MRSKMTLNISDFKGELPILDDKVLPNNAASKAVNCDFRQGGIYPLPPYHPPFSPTASAFNNLFFLSAADSVDVKGLLVGAEFHAQPATAINTDRVVFVFNKGDGAKKATLSEFTTQIGSTGFYREIDEDKPLGVPKPTEKMEVEKIPTYTDYSEYKVYYKGDIVHVHDPDPNYTNWFIICTAASSVGKFEDVFDWTDENKNKWLLISRFDHIPITYSPEGVTPPTLHDKKWIYNEDINFSGSIGPRPQSWAKHTDDSVIGEGDLIQYKDGNIYRARFDNINRNRPDDPNVWTYLIDTVDIIDAHNNMAEYNIRRYSSTKSYTAGEICLEKFGIHSSSLRDLWWMFVCNITGTVGVSPTSVEGLRGEGRWSIITAWDKHDRISKSQTTFNEGHGIIGTADVPLEGGGAHEDQLIFVPYITTHGVEGYTSYTTYRYVDDLGEERQGLFRTNQYNAYTRPYNPAWAGWNPWELYADRHEIAIDRSEIYDSIAYVYTWVTAWGEESEPSDPTEVMDAHHSEVFRFKVPSPAPIDTHITHFRVYRLSSGTRSAEYLLFQNEDFTKAQVNNWIEDKSSSLYTIKPAKDLVQDALQTLYWNEPKDELTGFVSLSNGCLAGFVKDSNEGTNVVYFSEPWVYYAWPGRYQVAAHNPIVGLGAFDNTVVVCTNANPEIINCPLPEQTSQIISPHTKPCMSAKSIVSAENFVLYAGHDGLVRVDQSGMATTLTAQIISETQWVNDYTPGSIAGVYYNGMYVGVILGTSRGFMIPLLQEPYIVQLDLTKTGTTSINSIRGITINPYNGLLYISGMNSSGNYATIKLDPSTAGTTLTWEWESKQFLFPDFINFAAGKIDLTSPVTLTMDTNRGQIVKNVSSTERFRLPVGRYKEMQFTLEGSGSVIYTKFNTSMADIR